MDMTPCAYSKDRLASALVPAANVMDLSSNGLIALLMRGNVVRSQDKRNKWTKVHVVSGIRTGCDCWLSLDSIIWDGEHIKGRGVVEPHTVCLSSPEEFDERFYLPGCCRDEAYRTLVKTKPQLAGPVRVIDGRAIRIRPAPYDMYVWRVSGTLIGGKPTTCWVPVDSVDLDEPDDFVIP